MSSSRVWLFRGLVAVAASLLVVSFIMPWWSVDVSRVGDNVVTMYPYGLRNELGPEAGYITGSEPPFLLTVVAWAFLAVSVGLLLYSMCLKGKRGKLLLGLVGLAYIGFTVTATIYAAISTGAYEMSMIGASSVTVSGIPGDVYASFQPGYYLAYGVGLLCIALALLRDKVTGKPKLNT